MRSEQSAQQATCIGCVPQHRRNGHSAYPSQFGVRLRCRLVYITGKSLLQIRLRLCYRPVCKLRSASPMEAIKQHVAGTPARERNRGVSACLEDRVGRMSQKTETESEDRVRRPGTEKHVGSNASNSGRIVYKEAYTRLQTEVVKVEATEVAARTTPGRLRDAPCQQLRKCERSNVGRLPLAHI